MRSVNCMAFKVPPRTGQDKRRRVQSGGSASFNLERMTASYEGEAPYDCRDVRALGSPSAKPEFFTSQRSATHLCPPAPGNERGRGSYHIVATGYRGAITDPPLVFEADATDVFDGCGGSRATVELTLKPEGS
jgi:hypothetical protein